MIIYDSQLLILSISLLLLIYFTHLKMVEIRLFKILQNGDSLANLDEKQHQF